jgi:hypothetical protein
LIADWIKYIRSASAKELTRLVAWTLPGSWSIDDQEYIDAAPHGQTSVTSPTDLPLPYHENPGFVPSGTGGGGLPTEFPCIPLGFFGGGGGGGFRDIDADISELGVCTIGVALGCC